ncbi:sensor histidine kinase KdpD [Steroidobacter sp. S1-65]|uniref:histidine kinase n=1 Tax=Steroidobacter gossypii TaxID=2805490 RepID=A0ABS1WY72_9GAMM|nr:sensor histidine kinase KdpD [Steroidobacter gossypii]MBM0105918.1 sensor histidine kinase KdpD [Steroidobacter gossypii]
MIETRPDPDQLLASLKAEEARARRGKLRIFFGASAGVGKTYSMLEAARGVRASGGDIAIGYIEPHGRVETERLLEGLEQLPTVAVHYRGTTRREFNLDAGLRRRPAILVVDELAHSNLIEGDPPPRHAKRWQDIEELLDQGVNVWTTVNVQHIESLNDLVAQITGVRQLETIPDRIFDEADEIELIDLPPEDLIARLKAGKVYVPEQAATAIERFFRKSNLIALRELALRRVADRVDAAARASALSDRTSRAWMARDRVLVAIGPDEQAEQVVRAGKRIADGFDALWTVIYVETPKLLSLSTAERNRRIDLLRLAESLGAETVTLDGPSAAQALLEYARTRKATRLVVGAPKRRGWRGWLCRSTTYELVGRARGFDVIAIGAPDEERTAEQTAEVSRPEVAVPVHWNRYAWALTTSAIATVIAFAMFPYFELANIVMAYVLASTIAAVRFGRGPAVVAAVMNVIAFDFCFVPPRFTFSVADAQYIVTFTVMLIVAVTIANLMASVRQQTRVAGARERRTASLYAMSRELAATRGVSSMARVAVRHVTEVFDCKAVVLLPDDKGRLHHPNEAPVTRSFTSADLSIAQWVMDHGKRAGLGSDTLPAAPALYVPLSNERQRLGVLAVLPENRRRILLPEQRHLLETFAGQLGLAMERAQLAEAAETSRVAAETESLRNTLLASISHDLRTPLAVIAGAGSTLAQRGRELDEASRNILARSIETKAQEMSDVVSNVLDLMRFESGQIVLRREWETLDDLVGAALARTEERMRRHAVDIGLPSDLPPLHVDATLIVQVLVNLLDNIAKYTPSQTRVYISAQLQGAFIRVTVEDDGPGLPPTERDRLFEKFQRGEDESAVVGAGLGLAICRTIVRAHGGEIVADDRPGGGARFQFTLPIEEPTS